MALAIGLSLLGMASPTRATSPLYPDLRSVPPNQLRLDRVLIGDATHHVLRFTTTVWNAGPGPLELRGESSGDQTLVYQRLHDEDGGVAEHLAGEFVFHEAHNHWHFEHFADYELWPRADYDAWLTSARSHGQAHWRGSKTTGQGESVCVRDSRRVEPLAESPPSKSYRTCQRELQGISVGWGDTYKYTLPEQWIDVGEAPLPNGEYVLRTVADPLDLLQESDDRDPERESQEANEAVTVLEVRRDRVRVLADGVSPGPNSGALVP